MSECSSVWRPSITEVPKSGGILLFPQRQSSDFTIPENYNAESVGPFSIDSGVTVTVPSGSRWVII